MVTSKKQIWLPALAQGPSSDGGTIEFCHKEDENKIIGMHWLCWKALHCQLGKVRWREPVYPLLPSLYSAICLICSNLTAFRPSPSVWGEDASSDWIWAELDKSWWWLETPACGRGPSFLLLDSRGRKAPTKTQKPELAVPLLFLLSLWFFSYKTKTITTTKENRGYKTEPRLLL